MSRSSATCLNRTPRLGGRTSMRFEPTLFPRPRWPVRWFAHSVAHEELDGRQLCQPVRAPLDRLRANCRSLERRRFHLPMAPPLAAFGGCHAPKTRGSRSHAKPWRHRQTRLDQKAALSATHDVRARISPDPAGAVELLSEAVKALQRPHPATFLVLDDDCGCQPTFHAGGGLRVIYCPCRQRHSLWSRNGPTHQQWGFCQNTA